MAEKLPLGQRPEPGESGDVSEKGLASRELVMRFQDWHEVSELESPKSAIDSESIALANEVTNEFLEELGLPTFDIPEKNFHLIDSERFADEKRKEEVLATIDGPGRTFALHQGILINTRKTQNPIFRASVMLHEAVHLKSALVVSGDSELLGLERLGVHRNVRRGEEVISMGEGLAEALASETERRGLPMLLSRHTQITDIIHRDYDSLAAIARREAIARRYGVPFDEVIYAGAAEEDYMVLAYLEQREALWYVIDMIAKDRKEHSEDVWPIFLRAQFTGTTNEIERLVNQSFGAEGYRILEQMDITDASATISFTKFEKIRAAHYGHKN